MFEQARPFLLALLIGLLIGVERERSTGSDPDKRPLGSRTFALLAMLGALAGHLGAPMGAVLALFASATVLAGYLRAAEDRRGFTTEVAGMVVFALGVLAHHDPALAVMLAVLTLALLASKSQIHHFARAGIEEAEVTAAVVVLVLAFVVLPLLPDRHVDPWKLVNPFRLWLIFVLINALSFAGYVAVRLLGPRRGFPAWGGLAGLVSSTAATVALSHRAGEGASLGPIAAGIVLANAGSAAAQLLVAGVAAPSMLAPVLPVIAAPVAVALAAAWVGPRLPGWSGGGKEAGDVPLSSPIALKPSALFAVIIAVVLVASSLASRLLGPRGAILATVAGGAADVHAATLAAVTLASSGSMPSQGAVLAILGAFLANMTVKLVLAGWIGGRGLLARVAPPMLAMMAAAAVAYWVEGSR
ncbi:MAG TPA: DUF4010 domain-containing protein [Candidatus Polarisedimenticolaceae bacterium]|nr:DUF4010 domain-containing protein [Candidatus Polarisedimenticolaceae bacterium]